MLGLGIGKLQHDAVSVRYFPGAGPIAAFKLPADACVHPNDFFTRYATDFGLRAGIDAVVPNSVQPRPTARYVHQEFQKVAVSGYGYIFDVRPDGCVDRGTGHLVSPLSENVTPSVSADVARRTAFDRVGAPLDPALAGELKLIADRAGGGLPGSFRLVWEFRPRGYLVLVDAVDGGVYLCDTELFDGPRCPASGIPSARPHGFGKLYFNGEWDVTVRLDGTPLGLLPTTQIAVAPGRHTVVVDRDGVQTLLTPEVAANEIVVVHARLD